MSFSRFGRTPTLFRLIALAAFLLVLAIPFRAGWLRATTDFPNYYTAAALVRQRQPLRSFYDWTWFQRRMNYAGIEHQLGSYTPQTPLTMLPMVPLAGLPVQRAKQVWLMCSMGCLLGTVWLLSRVTRQRVEHIWLLAFGGYFSLASNLVLGQYYLFLLFLLTLSFYLLERGDETWAGCVMGLAFALKLYGGPFLLFFVARRRWRALLGMALALFVLGSIAIALFGFGDVSFYLAQVLPRSLEGGSVDPYNPGNGTLATLLHRVFVPDMDLNPNPLFPSPWLFFFLRTATALAIVGTVTLAVASGPASNRQDFAWFCIAAMLLSTSTASYSFILLLLPTVLLLEESDRVQQVVLIGCYVLLNLPLRPAWLFPRVWLLLFLFIVAGAGRWRVIPRRRVLAAAGVVVLVAAVDAGRHVRSYTTEPQVSCEQVAPEAGVLFSGCPVVTHDGLFYQAMGNDRYVIKRLNGGRLDAYVFNGQALCPRVATANGPIVFELVSGGRSRMMVLDPHTGKAMPAVMPVPEQSSGEVVSPDRKWAVVEFTAGGWHHLLLRDLRTGNEELLAGGACNSSSPAWELDSQSVVFESDCGRAFGLPVLYRRVVGTRPIAGTSRKTAPG